MYGLIKTHRANNPTRVITSGCRTEVEFLFLLKNIYIKKLTKQTLEKEDTLYMLDVVNMLPSIDNDLGLEAVSEIFYNRESSDFPPAKCILDDLKPCLDSYNCF